MTLDGNKDLLDRELVAFFASRRATDLAMQLACEWAHRIATTEKVIISGFHSPVERRVLDILLAERCSVVVTLGRKLYQQIPPHLHDAYNAGRILFVSFRDNPRASFSNSQLRNWATTSLATEVVFAPFDDESQLSTLYFTLSGGATPCRILDAED